MRTRSLCALAALVVVVCADAHGDLSDGMRDMTHAVVIAEEGVPQHAVTLLVAQANE